MKPKTQRLPKKKQQEEAIKQAQLKSKIKPQPAPEKTNETYAWSYGRGEANI
jgi:outer membrane biosynthesis protein TonB